MLILLSLYQIYEKGFYQIDAGTMEFDLSNQTGIFNFENPNSDFIEIFLDGVGSTNIANGIPSIFSVSQKKVSIVSVVNYSLFIIPVQNCQEMNFFFKDSAGFTIQSGMLLDNTCLFSPLYDWNRTIDGGNVYDQQGNMTTNLKFSSPFYLIGRAKDGLRVTIHSKHVAEHHCSVDSILYLSNDLKFHYPVWPSPIFNLVCRSVTEEIMAEICYLLLGSGFFASVIFFFFWPPCFHD